MEKRTKVVEEYKSVQESSKPITAILESAELAEQISNSRDYRQLVEYLAKAHNVISVYWSLLKSLDLLSLAYWLCILYILFIVQTGND